MRTFPLPVIPLIICALLIARGFAMAQDYPPKAPGLHPYIALAESEPVKIGSLEFVAAVQKEWPLFPGREIRLTVQLYIFNRGDKDVLFPTFDTFSLRLKDANGNEVRLSGGRDGTMFANPVLVPAGGRYCLSRSAMLKTDGKDPAFTYEDGTGSWTTWGPLPGDYTLRFFVGNSPDDPPGIMSDGAMIPLWKGKGETKEAKFKVIRVKQ